MTHQDKLELDNVEQLTLMLTELKNSLNYIKEFHLIVDRESKEVTVEAKFVL